MKYCRVFICFGGATHAFLTAWLQKREVIEVTPRQQFFAGLVYAALLAISWVAARRNTGKE